MTDWRGTVQVQYGTVVLEDAGRSAEGQDSVDSGQLWEARCGTFGDGIQVLVPERDDDVPAHIRVLGRPAAIDAEWEHVAEVGFRAPTGRIIVYSWMPDEDVVGEVAVPTGPLVARIHWAGLEAWLADRSYLATGGPGPVRLRIDLVPGELDAVRTLRTWHLWAPPVHESTSPAGLRRFRGLAVAPQEAGLVLVRRQFWPPYPATEEGTVQALWRDPRNGSRWAHGSGPMGHPFLQELTAEEADAVEAESFPMVHTYARDGDGRIWSADLMPLERAPALLLIPSERWAMFQGLFTGDEVQLVDLPPGWSRITRRSRDGTGSDTLVDGVMGDGDDGYLYRRWPDGAEIPT